MRDRAQRAIAECKLIAGFTEEPGLPLRTTRRFLTPPVHDVHRHLRARMEALGMTTRVDAAGNLRGVWRPDDAAGKRLVLGSHIDTVPNAGAYDGVLGVALALEWVGIAQELAVPFPIEVIAFSEEEGVRYGVPFLGSRAVAGSFDRAMLAYEDANGVRMDDAMRAFGLDPAKLEEAVLEADALGFIEMHIEQGPVLEAENLPLAVVTAIAGQTRLGLRFTGQANHAGTTPMHLRRDALAAAAEWVVAVEAEVKKAAAEGEKELVATVGKLAVEPNAGNVVPGVVSASLDIRHISNRARSKWVTQLTGLARSIAARRGIELECAQKSNERVVEMDRFLTASLEVAIESAGFPQKRMHSGAGHDAMVMAARVPTTMLFLRSPGGISHHPAEAVLEEDVEAALLVGCKFLEQLANEIG
jgi:allantoate deiminase